MEQFKGTTILSVRKGNSVVIGGDGQVTMGDTVMKGNARKVRRLYNDKVIAGFDRVALDSYGATLLGLTASEVKMIVDAHQLGLGENDLGKLRIKEMELG